MKKYIPIPDTPKSVATISNKLEPVFGKLGGAVAPKTGGGVGVLVPQEQSDSSWQLGFLQYPLWQKYPD